MNMIHRLTLSLLSILIFTSSIAKTILSTEDIIRKVADHILKNASFGFEDIQNPAVEITKSPVFR